MAFDAQKPQDQGYLADFPPEMREQLRAIIHDEIVNAGLLMGLIPGNAGGNIAVNNGSLNQNLNAAMLEGKSAEAFALTGHTHGAATVSSDGMMTAADKVKLGSIHAGAEENQNAFSVVDVGGTLLQADNKTDTGNNISLIPDAANDRITIGLSGAVESANAAGKLSVGRTIAIDGKVNASGVAFDGTRNISLNVTNVTADSCTGNAATANRLSTSRILRLTGNTSGEAFFDGSGNVTIETTTTSAQRVEEMSARNGFKELVKACMALNDYFRIGVGGDNNGGYAEIATADDGNEPIVVRQYTGMFQNLIRTLTLLDGNGNTTFPGHVTAQAFHGNADSASRLEGHSLAQIQAMATKVAVLSGTIAHGATIPLPEGYTEEQCKWMVSMTYPWTEYKGMRGYVTCYTEGRTVICAYHWYNNYSKSWMFNGGVNANYIVIGVK